MSVAEPERGVGATKAGLERLEAWFVTGSQHLYGGAVLERVDENARHIARCLDQAADVPVRIVAKPVVTTPEAIEAVLREADAAPDCVGVVAWMHTFSPAKMWIGGLSALRKPLVHLHTQYNRDLPWADIDMDFMNLNQAAHGDREFAFIQTRLRRARKTIVGHWEDPAVASRLGWWSRAAAGWREASRLRVARFGDNMRQVAVTEGDKVEAQARLGFSVNGYGVNELVERVAAVSDAEVTALAAEYEDRYAVAPGLRRSGERHRELRTAARIEAGLRSFLGDGGFGAFTDTFEDLGGLEQLPGIAVQRLMADGYGFGAEGDWKAAALVRILKVMADGLPGGTSFMEDYTYHLGDPVPEVLGAHMLEVCPSLTADRPSCEIHPLAIGGRSDPVRLVFDASPGPAVLVGLVDLGDRFRLITSEVDVVAPDAPLPKLPVARAVWRPRPTLAIAAEAWLMAGGPHHTAMTTSLEAEALTDFADIADLELVAIDASTTPSAFKRELRWNQAYYFLNRGP
ncbi:MAG TPA: L-arabinose isomerase [Candidatus Limnocylindrales bacterium]|nr:L-arabinose isomerase [Candidatus Limnocylindrales bacterium]